MEILELLLESGVDLNAAEEDGDTLIRWVVSGGDEALAGVPVDAAAEVDFAAGGSRGWLSPPGAIPPGFQFPA